MGRIEVRWELPIAVRRVAKPAIGRKERLQTLRLPPEGQLAVHLRSFGATVDILRLVVCSRGLPSEARPKGERRMVDLNRASRNHVGGRLRRVEA